MPRLFGRAVADDPPARPPHSHKYSQHAHKHSVASAASDISDISSSASLSPSGSESDESGDRSQFGSTAGSPACTGPGAFGLDWGRYATSSHLSLPRPLRPLLALPGLRSLTVAARPTFSPSGGFSRANSRDAPGAAEDDGPGAPGCADVGYREAVPKRARSRSLLFVVVDEPGLTRDGANPEPSYEWVEFPLPGVYRIDVAGAESFDEWAAQLPKGPRRNLRKRGEAWRAAGVLAVGREPLAPGNEARVEELWQLYRANAERNGLLVTSERRFKRLHLASAPSLTLFTVRDVSRGGALVSFATGYVRGDTLVSAWCGTDYSHPLSRTCSCYIETQASYEMVRAAIEDPDVRWIDLLSLMVTPHRHAFPALPQGAQHGTMKRGIGAQQHAVAGYLRCKNKVTKRLTAFMMRLFFDAQLHLRDPSPAMAAAKLQGLSEEQVHKAVKALLKYVGTQKEKSTNLLEDEDELLYLVIALKKVPQKPRNDKPQRLPLPHPIYVLGEGVEVCLFVKDHKGEGHKAGKLKVKEERVAGVAKVIGLSKLKTKYESHEAKRQLCNSYDLFLADDRVLPSLPKLIGKAFFKKKKQPVPVRLSGKDWAGQIRRACEATYLHLSGGSALTIRVARSSQSEAQCAENVFAALAAAVDKLPRKWAGVQSLFLKTSDSVSLPIYQAVPPPPAKI
eukprot:scaffold25.g5117.t1